MWALFQFFFLFRFFTVFFFLYYKIFPFQIVGLLIHHITYALRWFWFCNFENSMSVFLIWYHHRASSLTTRPVRSMFCVCRHVHFSKIRPWNRWFWFGFNVLAPTLLENWKPNVFFRMDVGSEGVNLCLMFAKNKSFRKKSSCFFRILAIL